MMLARMFHVCVRVSVLAFAAALVGEPGARADVLTIGTPANQGVPLRLQGVANKDYVIQTTDVLAGGNWTSLSTGATDGTGAWQASDSSPVASTRFYRGARLPGLQTTTTSAATVPNDYVTLGLDGNDPLNPGGALTAIITQLPGSGTLQQWDGTPITAAGTAVTDSLNRVRYISAASGGMDTSFGYELQRASNGVTSLPQTVAVSLQPTWVFSSFDDVATPPLQLAYSTDGVNWANTRDLYRPPTGDGVRDTSITRINGVYYVAYTAGNFGGVPYVQIARSPDLVNWTYVGNVDTSFPYNGYYSWAPEWFIDRDGTVYLFVSRQTSDYRWGIYWTKATSSDLTTWTPVQRIGGELGNRGAIDPFVVRDGDTYYLMYRNYGAPGGTDCIEMARGTSPTEFSLYKTGDWAGWGSPREGPCLVHLGGAHWRIYYSLVVSSLNGSIIARRDSTDNMATWTDAAPTGLPSHGTCLLLTGATGVTTDRSLPANDGKSKSRRVSTTVRPVRLTEQR